MKYIFFSHQGCAVFVVVVVVFAAATVAVVKL